MFVASWHQQLLSSLSWPCQNDLRLLQHMPPWHFLHPKLTHPALGASSQSNTFNTLFILFPSQTKFIISLSCIMSSYGRVRTFTCPSIIHINNTSISQVEYPSKCFCVAIIRFHFKDELTWSLQWICKCQWRTLYGFKFCAFDVNFCGK